MPVYEYRCNDCRSKIALFVKGFSGISKAICTNCGSENLVRLFSTFSVVKTDKDVYEDILGDNQLIERMMANDPSALIEWSRKMEGTQGEQSPEYEEMIERMEKGERVENVMADMQQKELAPSETDSFPGLDE